jgi:L-asparaginase
MPPSNRAAHIDTQPTIAVLTLGGTIGMIPADNGDKGVRPALSAAQLLQAIPDLEAHARLRVTEVMNKPSPHLTFDDLCRLSEQVQRECAAGVDGIVIVQGTDTIEVTAYVLDILTARDTPIVVTGAMRAPHQPGADGPANLLAAIRTAASPNCRGLGALVVMNDEIHAARYVTKRHSSSPAAFCSDPGPLGYIVEGHPRILFRPTTAPTLLPQRDRETLHAIPKVAHMVAEIGDDGRLVEAAIDQGYAGLIVCGMGGGHVPPAMVPVLALAAKKVPVVLASKCPSGGVLAATYGYAGAEIDLLERGLIGAGRLSASKAHAALTLALYRDCTTSEIRTLFAGLSGKN